MDVLRAALGDAKLTYLGKSYGTYLGTWYAQLFPSHVRALVLDGAVDPRRTRVQHDAGQAQGFQVALASFVATAFVCRVPARAARRVVTAAIARLQGLLNGARASRSTARSTGSPGHSAAAERGGGGPVQQSYWPYLREGLTAALAGNGSVLVELGDLLVERSQNGQYSNLTAAETAMDCLDRPWPRSLSAYRSAAAAAAKAAPMFGAALMWGSLPCAYWPVRAAPARLRGAGAPPILVVGTTRDPATPFRWAQGLAHDLASGVLLGWNGDGHTAYMVDSSCVDSAVDRYLISLVPPRNGTICP